MDIDGKDARQLTDNKVGENGARLSPDGKQILFTAFANEFFDFYYNDKIFLIPADGDNKARVPMPDLPYAVNGAEWSADGSSIYFSANMGSHTQLWQYDLTSEKLSQLTEGQHSAVQWFYQRELDQHIMAISTADSPGDIFRLQDGTLNQITHHYDYLQQTFFLPRQELISWPGEDGVTVEGIIHYPHDYEPGKHYPMVVQTHGGPASSDKYGLSRSISRYIPVLASHGYIVFQPNYRGSTGYGDDFLRDMVGGYYRQSHLDVMAGVDHLIDQGIADPDRLVKMGWSAGGHMTNKIITFTNRFKAASSGAGAVNWIGMYAQSDVRTYRTPWFGGTPWQEDAPIDVYWDHSPLKDISNVTTPTLVMVGRNDLRVPFSQSLELYRALKSLGVPTHLYVAPREPHGWSELRHRLYKINVELEWFARYALDKEYHWKKVEE
jgi:dipeptidyl aminopeptidase/acylaminoacyl peptidase